MGAVYDCLMAILAVIVTGLCMYGVLITRDMTHLTWIGLACAICMIVMLMVVDMVEWVSQQGDGV